MNVVFGSADAAAVLTADRDKRNAHQTRRKSVGGVRCQCGRKVTMWAETEEWYQRPRGWRWYHQSYGPGIGECPKCGAVYVEDMEGRLFRLKARENDEEAPIDSDEIG